MTTGESLTPGADITMQTTEVGNLATGASIDPINYYGQSFVYDEWVKTKIKELQGQQAKADESAAQDREKARQDKLEQIARKEAEIAKKQAEIQSSESFKKNYQEYQKAENKRVSDKAEANAKAEEAFKKDYENQIHKPYGTYEELRARMEESGALRQPVFETYTWVTAKEQYDKDLSNAKQSLDQIKEQIKQSPSSGVDNELLQKYDAAASNYEKIATTDPYASNSPYKSFYRTNEFYGTTTHGGGGAVNAAWNASQLPGGQPFVDPSIPNQAIMDQVEANRTGHQVGSALPMQSILPAQTMTNAGYTLKTEGDTSMWVDKEGRPFTGNAWISYKVPDNLKTPEILGNLIKDAKSVDDLTKLTGSNTELNMMVSNALLQRNADYAAKIASLTSMYNANPSPGMAAAVSDGINNILAHKQEFVKGLSELKDTVANSIVMKESPGVRTGSVAGKDIISTGIGEFAKTQDRIPGVEGSTFTGLVSMADVSKASQYKADNPFASWDTSKDKMTQQESQKFFGDKFGITSPAIETGVRTGSIAGHDIFNVLNKGEKVLTLDNKLTDLKDITTLSQIQRQTGEFGPYGTRYHRNVGNPIYGYDSEGRQIQVGVTSETEDQAKANRMLPDIQSEMAKSTLIQKLTSPKLVDKYAGLVSTGKTRDGLDIVNKDYKDYVIPRSGTPILLSDYMSSTTGEKGVMLRTPSQNILGEKYNESSQSTKDIIDEVAKMGQIRSGTNFDIKGTETDDTGITTFDRIMRQYNQSGIDITNVPNDENYKSNISKIAKSMVIGTAIPLDIKGKTEEEPYTVTLGLKNGILKTDIIGGNKGVVKTPESKLTIIGKIAKPEDLKLENTALKVDSSVNNPSIMKVNDAVIKKPYQNTVISTITKSPVSLSIPGIGITAGIANIGGIGFANTTSDYNNLVTKYRKAKQSKPKIDVKASSNKIKVDSKIKPEIPGVDIKDLDFVFGKKKNVKKSIGGINFGKVNDMFKLSKFELDVTIGKKKKKVK